MRRSPHLIALGRLRPAERESRSISQTSLAKTIFCDASAVRDARLGCDGHSDEYFDGHPSNRHHDALAARYADYTQVGHKLVELLVPHLASELVSSVEENDRNPVVDCVQ